MPFFQIVNGLISFDGTTIKPGMIVEWTEEQAASWYPNQKGWIKKVEDPHPKPEPKPEIKRGEPMPDPAEMSAYSDPVYTQTYEPEVTAEPKPVEPKERESYPKTKKARR
jgi:hypothetical protein